MRKGPLVNVFTRFTVIPNLALGIGLVLACIVALGVFAVAEAHQMAQATDRIVAQAMPVNVSAQDTLLQMLNEETGVRAFVATGQPLYLQPYTAGRRGVATDLAALARYYPDQPVLRHLIETAAKPQIHALDAYFTQLVAAVRAGHRQAALGQFAAGKQRMDAFRATMAAVRGEATDVVSDAHEASAAALAGATVTTGIATGTMALFALAISLGLARSIATRLRAEAATRASAARFRALSEQASDLVSVVDTSGTIAYASPSYQAILSYAPADLHGQPIFALVHPDDVSHAQRALRTRIANVSAPQAVTFRVRHADGSWRTVEVLGNNRLADPAVAGIILNARDITERTRAEEALRHQALHDCLTDLPNRTLLHDRLEQAVRVAHDSGRPLGLLLVDLDRFKEVNDTFGHPVGDRLLQEVAARFRRTLQASATIARLGGDEFAVLLPDTDEGGAQQVASNLRTVLAEPFHIAGQAVHIGASIGIARCPAQSTDPATLLRFADVAMYAAKQTGGGAAVYDPAHDPYSPERLAVLADLRQAITQQDLVLYYQPKVALATGRVHGVEALVRWPHPQRGLIPPSEFIPLAEQHGLIAPLTLCVLEAALRQCRAWQQAGLDLGVAVNLSMWNLHDPALPGIVQRLLQQYAVPAARLRLELTESTLMADTTRTLEVLAQLRALGLHLSVDDFGTGYSSLAYLKQLPVDELKIDMSFVRHMAQDETDAAIVRSTIGLGRSLGLQVVAEGVENVESWALLAQWGCDVAQGYYLSRPLPAAELERWLRESAWSQERLSA